MKAYAQVSGDIATAPGGALQAAKRINMMSWRVYSVSYRRGSLVISNWYEYRGRGGQVGSWTNRLLLPLQLSNPKLTRSCHGPRVCTELDHLNPRGNSQWRARARYPGVCPSPTSLGHAPQSQFRDPLAGNMQPQLRPSAPIYTGDWSHQLHATSPWKLNRPARPRGVNRSRIT
jgi:hypothetical protein